MKLKLLFPIILISGLLFSCSQNPPLPVGSFEDVSEANNDMGFRMLKRLQEQEPDKNIFISPFSITSALSMTANGAEGATQTEMYEALGLSKLTETEVNSQYKNILTALLQSSQGLDFSIANGIFYRDGFNPKTDFLNQANDNFEGKVEGLDFDDPSAKVQINEWVENQTEERIKDMISNISADDMMFLINTIYLKGPWLNGFPERSTRKQIFTLSDGSQDSTDMMWQDSQFPYYQGSDFDAASFYLGKNKARFSVDIILPKESKGLEDVVKNISLSSYQSAIDGMDSSRIMVQFPKLELDYEEQLGDVLKEMGIKKAFQEREADLSGIAEGQNLFISRVKHKTFLKVDETGLEASGATSVGVSVTSLPPSFFMDHPFLMIIRDIESGTILFMGKVENPNA
ncbi:MAG: serpin family protein [Bacteroidia bacterium]|nr:serpin family protein [Bacteroidia bacterium]